MADALLRRSSVKILCHSLHPITHLGKKEQVFSAPAKEGQYKVQAMGIFANHQAKGMKTHSVTYIRIFPFNKKTESFYCLRR